MSGATKFLLAGTATLAVLTLGSQSIAQDFDIFQEVCDASGAVSLGADFFLLVDNNSNILRAYQFGTSEPVTSRDLTTFLGIEEGKEADIEATARVGGLVYFITSHGLNSEAKPREQRLRVFAQRVSDEDPGKLTDFGNPYVLLLQRMMAKPEYQTRLQPVASLAPEEGGINIEGLAEGPAGSLYAGFRSPATADTAIVMPILNPKQMLEAAPHLTVGEKAKDRLKHANDAATQVELGDPITFTTLGGLGIRSMEKIGDGYLIIAGPPGHGSNFKLFSWTGKVGEQPAEVPDRELTFADDLMVKPEVIFKRQNGNLYIVSDDGDLIKKQNNDVKCEDLDNDGKKHFRGFELPALN